MRHSRNLWGDVRDGVLLTAQGQGVQSTRAPRAAPPAPAPQHVRQRPRGHPESLPGEAVTADVSRTHPSWLHGSLPSPPGSAADTAPSPSDWCCPGGDIPVPCTRACPTCSGGTGDSLRGPAPGVVITENERREARRGVGAPPESGCQPFYPRTHTQALRGPRGGSGGESGWGWDRGKPGRVCLVHGGHRFSSAQFP